MKACYDILDLSCTAYTLGMFLISILNWNISIQLISLPRSFVVDTTGSQSSVEPWYSDNFMCTPLELLSV